MLVYPSQQAVFDIVLALAYSLALVWLVLGSAYRVGIWLKSRNSLPIPLAPAPLTRTGVVMRLCLELFAFRSLARASKTTWLASLLFHYALLWLAIVHLRFVFKTLPTALLPFIQYSGWATLCLMAGLLVLFLRRLLIDRVRYVSSPSDYLHLILLMSIVLSGTALKRVWPVNLFEVGEFLRGVFKVSWEPLPDHAGLIVHLLLVLVLLLVFPISKLLHGVGVIISPTFNQRDRG